MSLHWKRSHRKYKLQCVRSIYTWSTSVPIAAGTSTSGGADATMSAAIVPLQLADFSASSGTETTPTGYGSSQSGRVLATIHQFAMCSSFFSCSCFVFVFVLLLVLVLVGGWRWRLCLCLWLCRSYGRLQEKGLLEVHLRGKCQDWSDPASRSLRKLACWDGDIRVVLAALLRWNWNTRANERKGYLWYNGRSMIL